MGMSSGSKLPKVKASIKADKKDKKVNKTVDKKVDKKADKTAPKAAAKPVSAKDILAKAGVGSPIILNNTCVVQKHFVHK